MLEIPESFVAGLLIAIMGVIPTGLSSRWLSFWNARARQSDPFVAVGRTRADAAEFDALADDARKALDLNSHDSLLDIGVANGMLSSRLCGGVRRYTGCDYSAAMLQKARLVMPGATLSECSITDLAFDDASFDKVLCASVFQYLDDDEAMIALAEIKRVLKPGGRAFISGLQDVHRRFMFEGEITSRMIASRMIAMDRVRFVEVLPNGELKIACDDDETTAMVALEMQKVRPQSSGTIHCPDQETPEEQAGRRLPNTWYEKERVIRATQEMGFTAEIREISQAVKTTWFYQFDVLLTKHE